VTERRVVFGISNARNLYRACLFKAVDLVQGENSRNQVTWKTGVDGKTSNWNLETQSVKLGTGLK
jgi:hypothetical protein